MLIRKWFGWEEVDFSVYNDVYNIYGGNISTHPDVLNFQHERFNINHKYLAKFNSKGSIDGAICVWDDKYLSNDGKNENEKNKRRLTVPRDELILPINPAAKVVLPVSSRFISLANCNSILNCSLSINSKREICLVNDKYRFSTSKNTERKMQKILHLGGRIADCKSMCSDEIFDIFLFLTEARWGGLWADKQLTKEFFKIIYPLFFGNVLFIKNKPLAFNLTTKTKFNNTNVIEYIHSGTDFSLINKSFSPGEVLIYSNIKKAFSELSGDIRYSFGNPSRDYKKRWCTKVPLGRAMFPF
ncbi:TPA: GNAT family N-acetyltransferase [Vibrio vulnificus]|nr:GNAT family N-acetyltransferase [Vibrio vulnificus]